MAKGKKTSYKVLAEERISVPESSTEIVSQVSLNEDTDAIIFSVSKWYRGRPSGKGIFVPVEMADEVMALALGVLDEYRSSGKKKAKK